MKNRACNSMGLFIRKNAEHCFHYAYYAMVQENRRIRTYFDFYYKSIVTFYVLCVEKAKEMLYAAYLQLCLRLKSKTALKCSDYKQADVQLKSMAKKRALLSRVSSVLSQVSLCHLSSNMRTAAAHFTGYMKRIRVIGTGLGKLKGPHFWVSTHYLFSMFCDMLGVCAVALSVLGLVMGVLRLLHNDGTLENQTGLATDFLSSVSSLVGVRSIVLSPAQIAWIASFSPLLICLPSLFLFIDVMRKCDRCQAEYVLRSLVEEDGNKWDRSRYLDGGKEDCSLLNVGDFSYISLIKSSFGYADESYDIRKKALCCALLEALQKNQHVDGVRELRCIEKKVCDYLDRVNNQIKWSSVNCFFTLLSCLLTLCFPQLIVLSLIVNVLLLGVCLWSCMSDGLKDKAAATVSFLCQSLCSIAYGALCGLSAFVSEVSSSCVGSGGSASAHDCKGYSVDAETCCCDFFHEYGYEIEMYEAHVEMFRFG